MLCMCAFSQLLVTNCCLTQTSSNQFIITNVVPNVIQVVAKLQNCIFLIRCYPWIQPCTILKQQPQLELGPVATTISSTQRIHKVLPAFQVITLRQRSGVSAHVLSPLSQLHSATHKDTTCITARQTCIQVSEVVCCYQQTCQRNKCHTGIDANL